MNDPVQHIHPSHASGLGELPWVLAKWQLPKPGGASGREVPPGAPGASGLEASLRCSVAFPAGGSPCGCYGGGEWEGERSWLHGNSPAVLALT